MDSIPFHSPVESESVSDLRLLGRDFIKHFRDCRDLSSREIDFLPQHEIDFQIKKTHPRSPFSGGQAIIVGQIKSLTEREGLEFMLGDTITMINDESFYPATPDGDCKVIEIFKTQTEVRLFIRNKGAVLV